jgi:uncharacterized membrane protein HdeD (DUF308 family)
MSKAFALIFASLFFLAVLGAFMMISGLANILQTYNQAQSPQRTITLIYQGIELILAGILLLLGTAGLMLIATNK